MAQESDADFGKRIFEDYEDIQKHGPYQVVVSCQCGRKTTHIIPKEDWLKSDAPTGGRSRLLTRNTCPICAPDEFGEDEE